MTKLMVCIVLFPQSNNRGELLGVKLLNGTDNFLTFLLRELVIQGQTGEPLRLLSGVHVLPVKATEPLTSGGGVKGNIMEGGINLPLLQEGNQGGTLGQILTLDIEHMGVVNAVGGNHRQFNFSSVGKGLQALVVAVPGCHTVVINQLSVLQLGPQIGGVQIAGKIA
jgi:hypothetical protein